MNSNSIYLGGIANAHFRPKLEYIFLFTIMNWCTQIENLKICEFIYAYSTHIPATKRTLSFPS